MAMPASLRALGGVREHVLLQAYSTFRIGGPARYFFAAPTADAMVAALEAARLARMPVFVLGGGSNVLISDAGFNGVVIHDANTAGAFFGTTVQCGSGWRTMDLLTTAAAQGLGGMEFMAGIPGSVGSAIRGNAGAWGHAFSELLTAVEWYRDGRREHVKPERLEFAYRYSLLRQKPWVVLGATVRLQKRRGSAIHAEVAKIISDRQARLPGEPSLGSIFKNINLATTPVDTARLLRVLDISEAEYREKTKHGKLPAGFLSECLGLRGTRLGGAMISEQHGNIIINPEGKATADQVRQLMTLMKMRVRDQLGIQLEEEIQSVG